MHLNVSSLYFFLLYCSNDELLKTKEIKSELQQYNMQFYMSEYVVYMIDTPQFTRVLLYSLSLDHSKLTIVVRRAVTILYTKI